MLSLIFQLQYAPIQLKDLINIINYFPFHFQDFLLILIIIYLLMNRGPFYFLIKAIFNHYPLNFYIIFISNLSFLLIYFWHYFPIQLIPNFLFQINIFFIIYLLFQIPNLFIQ